MRTLIIIALLATLAACSRPGDNAELLEKIHDLDKRLTVVEFWFKGPLK